MGCTKSAGQASWQVVMFHYTHLQEGRGWSRVET